MTLSDFQLSRWSTQVMTDQPNQAVSILTPCWTYSLDASVVGNGQFSMQDPAHWSVILDGKVLAPETYVNVSTDMVRVTSPSSLGSRNLTVAVGPRFEGTFVMRSLQCRTLVDGT
jgi:hypothetical protein